MRTRRRKVQNCQMRVLSDDVLHKKQISLLGTLIPSAIEMAFSDFLEPKTLTIDNLIPECFCFQ